MGKLKISEKKQKLILPLYNHLYVVPCRSYRYCTSSTWYQYCVHVVNFLLSTRILIVVPMSCASALFIIQLSNSCNTAAEEHENQNNGSLDHALKLVVFSSTNSIRTSISSLVYPTKCTSFKPS